MFTCSQTYKLLQDFPNISENVLKIEMRNMSMWSVLNKKKGKCYNQQLKGTEKGHRHCDPLNTAADLTTLTCAADAWWRSCQLAKLMMTHSQS